MRPGAEGAQAFCVGLDQQSPTIRSRPLVSPAGRSAARASTRYWNPSPSSEDGRRPGGRWRSLARIGSSLDFDSEAVLSRAPAQALDPNCEPEGAFHTLAVDRALQLELAPDSGELHPLSREAGIVADCNPRLLDEKIAQEWASVPEYHQNAAARSYCASVREDPTRILASCLRDHAGRPLFGGIRASTVRSVRPLLAVDQQSAKARLCA